MVGVEGPGRWSRSAVVVVGWNVVAPRQLGDRGLDVGLRPVDVRLVAREVAGW